MSIPPVASATVRPPTAALPHAPATKLPSAGPSYQTAATQQQAGNGGANQALREYEADISQGQPAGALQSLARQITADAAL